MMPAGNTLQLALPPPPASKFWQMPEGHFFGKTVSSDPYKLVEHLGGGDGGSQTGNFRHHDMIWFMFLGKPKTTKHKEFWRDTPWCVSRLSHGHVPSVPSYVPPVPRTFCPLNRNFHMNRPKHPGCPWGVPHFFRKKKAANFTLFGGAFRSQSFSATRKRTVGGGGSISCQFWSLLYIWGMPSCLQLEASSLLPIVCRSLCAYNCNFLTYSWNFFTYSWSFCTVGALVAANRKVWKQKN